MARFAPDGCFKALRSGPVVVARGARLGNVNIKRKWMGEQLREWEGRGQRRTCVFALHQSSGRC